jgi:hypothetical protein
MPGVTGEIGSLLWLCNTGMDTSWTLEGYRRADTDVDQHVLRCKTDTTGSKAS